MFLYIFNKTVRFLFSFLVYNFTEFQNGGTTPPPHLSRAEKNEGDFVKGGIKIGNWKKNKDDWQIRKMVYKINIMRKIKWGVALRH